MIHDMKINIAALAIGHPTIQNIQREGQRFERAVASAAVILGKSHREAHDAIVDAMRTCVSLEDAVSSLTWSGAPQAHVERPPPVVIEVDPAPTCAPIGARLGRRLGVRR